MPKCFAASPSATVSGIDLITAPSSATPSTRRWGLLHALVGVGIFALCILGPSLLPAEWVSYPVWLAIVFALPVLVTAWIVVVSRRWGTGDLIRDYGLSFRWIDLLGIPAAFAAIWFIQPVVVYLALLMFGDPGGLDSNVFVTPEPAIWVPSLILSVIAAPFIEEVVFRGMLQPSLKRWFDGPDPDQIRSFRATNAAVLITAATFAALHLPQSLAGVNGVALTAATLFAGIVLGALAMATRRTAPSIVVHAASNLVANATAYGLVA
ncbi:CPBP family intramembrane glutamic endopeptidase [Agromyces indicus]|uniref:Type II CAAX endopeptidase family protein n=1 Tax=Agromyces indicus TaxID=758919 RepID=A0ABU1FIW0_9MICO|nr:type II CAAX endopeptidase family protein [Agromyces indicus]MDR5691267.1 type II CAAX endopeptidase family protein [Agromyces indicus]